MKIDSLVRKMPDGVLCETENVESRRSAARAVMDYAQAMGVSLGHHSLVLTVDDCEFLAETSIYSYAEIRASFTTPEFHELKIKCF